MTDHIGNLLRGTLTEKRRRRHAAATPVQPQPVSASPNIDAAARSERSLSPATRATLDGFLRAWHGDRQISRLWGPR